MKKIIPISLLALCAFSFSHYAFSEEGANAVKAKVKKKEEVKQAIHPKVADEVKMVEEAKVSGDASSVTVGFGLDVEYRGNNYNQALGGFLFNEGALYFNKAVGNHDALLDFAFTSDPTAGTVQFEMLKSQAYVTSKWGKQFKTKLGLMDSLLGFEGPDPWDRRFAQSGLMDFLGGNLLGAQAAYDFGGNSVVTIYASNPSGQGNVALAGRNMEYGGSVALEFSGVHTCFGGWMQKSKDFTDNAMNSLISANAGTVFGDFSIDVEYNKRATAGTSVGTSGLGAHLGYVIKEGIEVGARLEQIKDRIDDATLAAPVVLYSKKTGMTFGPQFTLSKDIKLRADVSSYSWEPKAEQDPSSTLNYEVGMVARF